MRSFNNLLVTGGCGFMGSAFIRYLLSSNDFNGKIVNLDLLTYAGNMRNVKAIETSPRYSFMQGNITDGELVEQLILDHEIDGIVNFAAETHVDRSIASPGVFMDSNIRGVFILLEAVRKFPHIHYHQISTDEVFGSLGESGTFLTHSPYRPNSPYSASKASADHLIRAYVNTYKISATISRAANNYGPYQFPEKFIPLMITNALCGRSLPVYGNGKNIRDWIFVEDHAEAVWEILKWGPSFESYNIGGKEEVSNIDLLYLLLKTLAKETDQDLEDLHKLITFIDDRPGHDYRYAMDTYKLMHLGFTAKTTLEEGLKRTISWFAKNLHQAKL